MSTRHTPAAPDRVRPATQHDLPEILRLVRELAEYEREPEAVEATGADFATALFPPDGSTHVFAHVAEVDGRIGGMAVWYLSFSTWTGRSGVWLEDLFVSPEHRGLGLGRDLLQALARVCVEQGYPRLEWWVLDWNEPALGFYRSLGAHAQDEWTTFRVAGQALQRLGGQGS